MPAIPENIEKINNAINHACKRCGRDPLSVFLVCVTKMVSVGPMLEAISAGVKILGESRVEEAIRKHDNFPKEINWHLIGHLQTRKVRDAVGIFDLIHSVDSLELALEIDKRAKTINKVQEILLEVNVSGEESKYGFKSESLLKDIDGIAKLSNIKVTGLMTMAPLSDDPEAARPVFKGLREISEEIKKRNVPNILMRHLSMGMSQDYKVAIEEGATLVRIGSAIFSG